MNEKPFLVSESYYPKEKHFDEVLNILKETSSMIKEQDGALMSLSLKPEKKEGIVKVKWKGPIKIQKALQNSYVNMGLLFRGD